MHYGRYYCAKLAGLFLFKVTPIVRTCIISISWKIIDNDNNNNNDDDDNDENRSANTEQQKIIIKIILKFPAPERKPEFCSKSKPEQIGICVDACRGDDDCSGSKKCCFNGCGHVCMKPLDMSINMVSPYLGFARMNMHKHSPSLFTTKFCYTPCRIACFEIQLEFEEIQLLVLTRQWKQALRDMSSSEKWWMNDSDMLVTIGVRSYKQHRIQLYFSYSSGTLRYEIDISSIQTVAKYSKIRVIF